jgi:uncharacterized protein (UPF0276 family)
MNTGSTRPGLSGCGIGLRSRHVDEILAGPPRVGWLEVHAENYMGGGPTVRALERIRRDHPLSIHGVGLSLGSADGIDAAHLARLAALVERLEPALVSEHLSWSIVGGVYLNHLLPLPCTEEALAVVAANVARVQDRLGRPLLVENPASYLRFEGAEMTEPEFLNALAQRTGCRVLCDVNNVFVSCSNLGGDAVAYLGELEPTIVGEIHLAGHAVNDADGMRILIDDHGSRVTPAVWQLYAHAVRRFGAQPTLVEWDTDVPALSVLLEESAQAERILRAEARDTRSAHAA